MLLLIMENLKQIVIKELPHYIQHFIFWYSDAAKTISIEFYHKHYDFTFTLTYPRVELEQFLVQLGLNENTGSFIENEINELTVRDLVVNNFIQPKELYAFVLHKKYLTNWLNKCKDEEY